MDEKNLDVLLKGFKAGSRDSFNGIFKLYYSPLVKFCYRFINDKDVCEEIVQDMFFSIWIHHEDLVIKDSLKSYLFRAIRNRALNYNAQVKRRESLLKFFPTHSEEEAVEVPLANLQMDDLKSSIYRVMLTMPDKRREIFNLSRFEGLKNKEIAEKLEISQKTVEAHISKALEQLRGALKDYG
jgi:RNA polymerase sigma factor, sigma-70 family/RNA polymerase sigma-70 factor, Bacteroides expansion family 1